MKEKVLVFSQPGALEACALEKWRRIAFESVHARGRFTAALSGGSTPEPFYKLLAGSDGLPWNETHLFMVDERFVPADHPDSNGRLVREILRPLNFHPVPTGLASPRLAADAYEEEIRSFFQLSRNSGLTDCPSFDLVVLGAGEDGHTASLFPGNPALAEKRRIALPVPREKHDRVTLTLPVLNRAKNAIFLLTGGKKASILRRILQRDITLPASLVRPGTGNLFFLADADAGSEVRSEILDS